jgi:hypothetical protein
MRHCRKKRVPREAPFLLAPGGAERRVTFGIFVMRRLRKLSTEMALVLAYMKRVIAIVGVSALLAAMTT